jgi:hypothetical protein
MDLNKNAAATMSVGSADDMKDLMKTQKTRNEKKKFANSNILNTSTKIRENMDNSPVNGKFSKNFHMRSNSTESKYLITITNITIFLLI